MTNNREEVLKNSFNNDMVRILSLPKSDYYSRLTIKRLIELKTIWKEVNNILTLRLSLAFMNWLRDCFSLSTGDCGKIRKTIMKKNPNTNGYDIDIDYKTINAVAEVKFNIPVNRGVKFGANQKKGIINDLNGLKNGKKKSSLRINTIKFLVLYDNNSVRKATTDLIKNLPQGLKKSVKVVKNPNRQFLKKSKIHVVFIKLK